MTLNPIVYYKLSVNSPMVDNMWWRTLHCVFPLEKQGEVCLHFWSAGALFTIFAPVPHSSCVSRRYSYSFLPIIFGYLHCIIFNEGIFLNGAPGLKESQLSPGSSYRRLWNLKLPSYRELRGAFWSCLVKKIHVNLRALIFFFPFLFLFFGSN